MKKNRKIICKMIVAIVTLTLTLAAQAQDIKLAKGEILYSGTTKLEKCDEVIVSFILSANKDTLKQITFNFKGIYVRSNVDLKKINSENSYWPVAVIKDGTLDYTYPWHGVKWQIKTIGELGSETLKGEVKCVYQVSSNQIEDLGTATVEFKKQETR